MFITEQKSKARQNGAWCLQNPSSKEQLGSTYNQPDKYKNESAQKNM